MDFPNHRGLVSVFPEYFLKLLLVVVEAAPVINLAVKVAVLTGQQGRPRRGTDGIGNIGPVENHALTGQPIDIRRQVFVFKPSPVGTNGVYGMVIGENPENIWPSSPILGGRLNRGIFRCNAARHEHAQQCKCEPARLKVGSQAIQFKNDH